MNHISNANASISIIENDVGYQRVQHVTNITTIIEVNTYFGTNQETNKSIVMIEIFHYNNSESSALGKDLYIQKVMINNSNAEIIFSENINYNGNAYQIIVDFNHTLDEVRILCTYSLNSSTPLELIMTPDIFPELMHKSVNQDSIWKKVNTVLNGYNVLQIINLSLISIIFISNFIKKRKRKRNSAEGDLVSAQSLKLNYSETSGDAENMQFLTQVIDDHKMFKELGLNKSLRWFYILLILYGSLIGWTLLKWLFNIKFNFIATLFFGIIGISTFLYIGKSISRYWKYSKTGFFLFYVSIVIIMVIVLQAGFELIPSITLIFIILIISSLIVLILSGLLWTGYKNADIIKDYNQFLKGGSIWKVLLLIFLVLFVIINQFNEFPFELFQIDTFDYFLFGAQNRIEADIYYRFPPDNPNFPYILDFILNSLNGLLMAAYVNYTSLRDIKNLDQLNIKKRKAAGFLILSFSIISLSFTSVLDSGLTNVIQPLTVSNITLENDIYSSLSYNMIERINSSLNITNLFAIFGGFVMIGLVVGIIRLGLRKTKKD